uniref:Bridging integrator 3 n=1 Tax=Neolamprologus brichardi TaxID=32507 RepID=A0A3Q4HZY4_NEOBR
MKRLKLRFNPQKLRPQFQNNVRVLHGIRLKCVDGDIFSNHLQNLYFVTFCFHEVNCVLIVFSALCVACIFAWLTAMSKAAVKISADLLSNPLCEQDQAFLDSMTALDTAMRRMDAFNQEKVNQIQKTVVDPLKKYSSVFPSLNMAVKRREQTLQDYKRLQAKVEKYEEKEKTGPVMVKLHQAKEELRPVKDDFEAKNKQLLDEMPKFYQSRIDYFQPSFEALIRAQVVYFTEMYKIFSELTDQIDQAGLTDEQRERETEAKLSELRALSIVADD